MTERLALLAGTGALVPEVIAAAGRRGYQLKLLTLGRRWDLQALKPTRFTLADPQGAVDAIRAFGATSFVMAGGVSISDIAREKLANFFSGGGQSIGDAGLSGFARTLSEMTGAKLLGVHEIAPELLAPNGHIGGPEPDALQLDTARHALDLARKAGVLDLGQAVVVAGGRAVAAEDVAGTDALIRRVRKFTRWGLAADGKSPLVLAKCAKPGQPLFVDLPAIGPRTVENARKAGISVIVVEAGKTLLIQRQALKEAADRLGVCVIGMAAGG